LKKILIIAPSWVGDTVMAQPLFKRLHELHPQLQLDVYAPAWCLPLLERMPEVNRAILNPFGHGQLNLKQRWQEAQKLKTAHYDQAIVLPNSFKSALIPFFAGIPLRTGFVGEMRYCLLNDARQLDKEALPLMVERFVLLAEKKGASIHRPIAPLKLNSSDAQRNNVRQKLNLQSDKPAVAFCPGAEYGPAKRWPADYFAKLAQKLIQHGYQIWIIGSQKDAAIAEAIRKNAPECLNLCGKTALNEAIDLLSLADFIVTNDSGLMHVSAAIDKPMIALYGSSSPGFTPPLSDRAVILKLDLSCSPCFKRECPLVHFNCMVQLTPDLVFKTIEEKISP
jgi:heptosyltransferase-2